MKGANQKGVVAIEGPLPPGCMQTVWRDDKRFVKTYWDSIPGRQIYSTFDWGIRDADGYFFILGRTDDVINVAGHRLGTREIEESISSHPNVAEVAVVGVADALKGQVAMAFVILKDQSKAATAADALRHEGEIMKVVDDQLGAVARPSRVRFVTALPKTRSGKLLRRAIQAVCEGPRPGRSDDDRGPFRTAASQGAGGPRLSRGRPRFIVETTPPVASAAEPLRDAGTIRASRGWHAGFQDLAHSAVGDCRRLGVGGPGIDRRPARACVP